MSTQKYKKSDLFNVAPDSVLFCWRMTDDVIYAVGGIDAIDKAEINV
ncbi:MAG: hypothetical protein LBQ66_14310 [Planctomycetaceae bacterium]|jgi:hypothetical protein|nr:hypothetical protein [Planctomycetaceae bacterium]